MFARRQAGAVGQWPQSYLAKQRLDIIVISDYTKLNCAPSVKRKKNKDVRMKTKFYEKTSNCKNVSNEVRAWKRLENKWFVVSNAIMHM